MTFQVPVYGSFRNAFQNIRSVLVEKIDVSHGLIDQLLQRGVLLDSHVSDIQVRTTVQLQPLHVEHFTITTLIHSFIC